MSLARALVLVLAIVVFAVYAIAWTMPTDDLTSLDAPSVVITTPATASYTPVRTVGQWPNMGGQR